MLPFENHFDHDETAYLMSSKANAEQLLQSLSEFESGNPVKVEWGTDGNLVRTDAGKTK